MSRLIVTGASGFIGQHLLRELSSLGVAVEGVVRAEVAVDLPLSRVWPSLSLIAADLEGVETVVHLAGLAHGRVHHAQPGDLFKVNVDQTVNLFRQAVAAGVKKFIWLSSIKVLGDASNVPLGVGASYQPGDQYAKSKVAAERQLLAEPKGGTQLCIVRPPLVYGPEVKANFLSLLGVASSGWPLPLKLACAPRAWVSVRNLVDFLIAVMHADSLSADSIWHVRDAEESSVSQMVQAIARHGGRSTLQWPLSPRIATLLGRCLGKQATVERLFSPLRIDMSETTDRLGWVPPQSQQESIEEVVLWYLTR